MINDKSKRILSRQTPELIGQKVNLAGWVKTRRDHGKLIFLDLRDRTGLVQLVVNPKVSEGSYKVAQEIRPEFVVETIGVVKNRPESTINKDLETGAVEVEVGSISVLSKAQPLAFDMGTEELNLELPTLLDYRALTLRHPKISPIFEVQEALVEGFRNASKKLGCREIVVPTIVASATEGGAGLFEIEYTDHKAF